MKAHELVKGKRYWCVWRHCYGWYIGSKVQRNLITGEMETIHEFQDICDAHMECEDKNIEKLVKENPGYIK